VNFPMLRSFATWEGREWEGACPLHMGSNGKTLKVEQDLLHSFIVAITDATHDTKIYAAIYVRPSQHDFGMFHRLEVGAVEKQNGIFDEKWH
jgi:hypothetical protein